MAKRALLLLLTLCFVLGVAGCGTVTMQNTYDLLRAPVLGGGLDEIQNALKAYLGGEEPQYKYPRSGEWRSPLLQTDLNGDGRQEAIVLYSVPETATTYLEKGSMVYIAVLERVEGVWTVLQDVQGMGTEVISVEVADLLDGDTLQLIVCFANANLSSTVFTLYQYIDFRLDKTIQYDYSRYQIGDFTGRGGNDLILVSRSDQLGGLLLIYMPIRDGHFVSEDFPAPVKLDANFVSCVNLVPGAAPDGGRLLVVDGHTATDNGPLASQMIYYSAENDLFYTTEDYNPLRGAAARMSPLLLSRDIDGDGTVEIPQQYNASGLSALGSDKRLEYIQWVDYTQPDPVVKQYGLLDSDLRLYLRLPDTWSGRIQVIDGEQASEWSIRNLHTGETLLILRYYDQETIPPPEAIKVPGTLNYYVVLGSRVLEYERNQLTWVEMG